MPVHIRPTHNLGPCQLDLSSIKGICELATKEFERPQFRAIDSAWEIYDEPMSSFLEAINNREKLDSFSVVGLFIPESMRYETVVAKLFQSPETALNDVKGTGTIPFDPDSDREVAQTRSVRIVFNESEAEVNFDLSPSETNWLEHFMFDLKKHTRPPTLLQRFGGFPIPLVFVGGAVVIPIKQPYCKIIIKPKQPNQRWISIKDNITASFLYDALKITFGIAIALLAAWVLSRFGIDILKFTRPPGSAG